MLISPDRFQKLPAPLFLTRGQGIFMFNTTLRTLNQGTEKFKVTQTALQLRNRAHSPLNDEEKEDH
jgi:hypothetical protein